MSCTWCSSREKIIGLSQQHLSGALSCHIWLYDYANVKQALHRAKYRNEYVHYSHLVQTLGRLRSLWKQYDFIVPIPTIASHVSKRGGDHGAALSRALSRITSLPVREGLVASHQSSQVRNSLHHRLRSPRYHVIGSYCNARILLVDDICTTRSTMMHAAYALRQGGARIVDGFSVAYQPQNYWVQSA